MADKARARKLADRIKVIVAETLELKVKDPRLGFITVTDVRVTGDCQQASVFYTVLGEESQHADTAEALESAKGVLRSEVGRQTGVRRTPSLTFFADAVPENAAYIEAWNEDSWRLLELFVGLAPEDGAASAPCAASIPRARRSALSSTRQGMPWPTSRLVTSGCSGSMTAQGRGK